MSRWVTMMRARMLTSFLQRITEPAMSADRVLVFADRAQLGSQHLDVRVDRAIQRGVRFFPGQFHQLVARINAPGLLDEHFQEAKLVSRQLQRRAAIPDLTTLFIDRKQLS